MEAELVFGDGTKGISLPKLKLYLDNASAKELDASPVLRILRDLVRTGTQKARP